MKALAGVRSVSAAAPTPPVPLTFIVVTFVAAGVVSAAILYFGLTGHLGTAIP